MLSRGMPGGVNPRGKVPVLLWTSSCWSEVVPGAVLGGVCGLGLVHEGAVDLPGDMALQGIVAPRLTRWRSRCPEDAGIGTTPHKRANNAS